MRINARRLVVGMTVAPLLSWCGTGGPVGRLVEGGDWFGGELCCALRSSVEERGEDRAADLLAGVDGGGGDAGVVGVDAARCVAARRGTDQAEPDAQGE